MGLFKKVGSRLIDVRVDKWMSWDYLGETSERFRVLLLDIVIPKKATRAETFEEAMVRLELTEEDLKERKLEFSRLFYFFIILSALIVSYGLYLAFTGSMISSLICFGLAIYALAQAFRFHFWLFQLKQRKLGCTIKEWINSKVGQEHKNEMIKSTKDVSKNPSEKASK